MTSRFNTIRREAPPQQGRQPSPFNTAPPRSPWRTGRRASNTRQSASLHRRHFQSALVSHARDQYKYGMPFWTALAITLASAAAMEGVAWASHKYIMHGFGWAWHRDHHEPHDRVLEKNDLFALFGAALSIAMFAVGSPWIMGDAAWAPGTWIGLGVLVYGIIYTLVHDGLVHQRYFTWVPRRGYAKRLVQAHRLHHATIGREGGVSFGFVVARDPARLKAELREQRAAGVAVLRDALDA